MLTRCKKGKTTAIWTVSDRASCSVRESLSSHSATPDVKKSSVALLTQQKPPSDEWMNEWVNVEWKHLAMGQLAWLTGDPDNTATCSAVNTDLRSWPTYSRLLYSSRWTSQRTVNNAARGGMQQTEGKSRDKSSHSGWISLPLGSSWGGPSPCHCCRI